MEELSLSTVIDNKSKYNLALPVRESCQVNPFYKFTLSSVSISQDENSGDIFKIGSKNFGDYQNPNWKDLYCLCKPALERLAVEAGMKIDCSLPVKVGEHSWGCIARAEIRLPDGTAVSAEQPKVIDLLVEEERIRGNYEFMAVKGITDRKRIEEASQLYKGETIKIQEYGKESLCYMLDDSEKARFIKINVMNAMKQLRLTAPQKAATGARNRAIRSLLGIKGTYTKDELSKPFIVSRMAFSPDYNDPVVKQMMIMQAIGSMGTLFGNNLILQEHNNTPLTAKPEDFKNCIEEKNFNNGVDIDNPEASPLYNSGFEPEAPTEPVVPPQPPKENTAEKYYATDKCSSCGAAINKAEYNYSIKNYNRPLCRRCQEIKRKADKR